MLEFHVALGDHDSNTFWNAAALIDRTRERTAMVVCNDGRAKLTRELLKLAVLLVVEWPGRRQT